MLAGAACYFLLLFSLFHPTLNFNPGLAAYVPPPGARLIPLPRASDAPELAELPADPPSPLTASAKAEVRDQQVKRDTRPPARKRPRIDSRGYDQQKFGFDQQWNFGSHDWSNNGAWSDNNRAWSGDSRSWF
jgi:hypothetical protein